MQLTLYYAPISCALVPFAGLLEAGADFKVEKVNLAAKGQHSPEFLRVNPKHQVPVLVIDGEVLTENVAIQQWIARQFPAARLLPAGAMAELQALSLQVWCAAGIHPFLTPTAQPQRYCDLPGSEDGVRRATQKILMERLGVAEQRLAGREWFFDHFTFPDLYFYWCFRRVTQFKLDVSALPACQAHFARVGARPSVAKVLQFEAETQAAWR